MKIKEYDTNELLMIANNVTGEYTDKKVRQAKLELYRRGVDDKVIADIMEVKEEAFMMHIPADTRSAFPVISVQSPVSIQCCWQS